MSHYGYQRLAIRWRIAAKDFCPRWEWADVHRAGDESESA